MAEKAFKSCATYMCTGITKARYCEKCCKGGQAKDTRGKWKKKSGDPFYSSKEWRSTRLEMLSQVDAWCKCTADYCPHIGRCNALPKVVDHKTPRSEGGSDDVSSGNLQTLCKPCHDRKTANEDARGARGTQVFLVCGPSGSGKTKYVRDHMRESDLAWDFDAMARTISKYPYHAKPKHILKLVFALKETFLKQLEIPDPDRKRVWIIESAPKAEQRANYRRVYKAKVIVLETSATECLRRIQADPNRDTTFDWGELIERWWREYVPSDGEQRITTNGE